MRCAVCTAIFCLTLVQLPSVVLGDDFLPAVSKIAQKEAVKQLKGKEFKFEQDNFQGTLKAVKPEEELDVSVGKLNLSDDLLTVQVQMKGPFEISGTLKQDDTTLTVGTTLRIEISLSGEAKFLAEGSDFFIQPKVKDLGVSIKIETLTPPDLNGGTGLISSIANNAFKKNKAKIIERINKSLKKQKIDI